MGCADHQRGVGTVAILSKRTAVVIDGNITSPDSVVASSRHVVAAGSYRNGSDPPALFSTAVAAYIDVVGDGGRKCREVIDGIENRDNVVHNSVGIHSRGTIAEFIGTCRSSVAPCHGHSISRSRYEVEVQRMGTVGLT